MIMTYKNGREAKLFDRVIGNIDSSEKVSSGIIVALLLLNQHPQNDCSVVIIERAKTYGCTTGLFGAKCRDLLEIGDAWKQIHFP